MRRAITSAQLKLRQMVFKIENTATTPTSAGFDRFQIDSIVDLGAGNFTIILANPFVREVLPIGGMVFGQGAIEVIAVAYDRVTVQISDLAGTPADLDFSLSIMGSDGRFDQ